MVKCPVSRAVLGPRQLFPSRISRRRTAMRRPAGFDENEGFEMQVTETLNAGLKRQIKVTVPAKDLEAKLVERLSAAKDKVRINGFRPGKVPLQHLRKVYGKSFMAE